jgi:Porin PorA
MRRAVGFILAGLGAFLIVGALLLRSYVIGQVLKFPINEYVKTTLIAKNVSYFSPALVKNVTGATIRITDTVKGDGNAGTSSTAVWDEFDYLYDVTNNKVYAYATRRAAFNRRTGELVDCCGANVNGDSTIRQTGLSGYVWPFGTQKKTYDVFDTNLNRPMPFRYEGTATIDGISAYRFVEHVPPTQAGSQKVPGSLVGIKQPMVTLPEYYSATNTYWVDPETGGVLDTTQDQKQALQSATGQQRLLLFDGDIVMTPQSEHTAVSLDAAGRNELRWFTVIVPLIAGLIGVVTLITGIVLVWLKRRDQPERAGTEEPEPALDPAL